MSRILQSAFIGQLQNTQQCADIEVNDGATTLFHANENIFLQHLLLPIAYGDAQEHATTITG